MDPEFSDISASPPRPPRVKRPKLAADGKPQEMFQDVKRACHRYLMVHDHDYRIEQRSIQIWMTQHHIPTDNLE